MSSRVHFRDLNLCRKYRKKSRFSCLSDHRKSLDAARAVKEEAARARTVFKIAGTCCAVGAVAPLNDGQNMSKKKVASKENVSEAYSELANCRIDQNF